MFNDPSSAVRLAAGVTSSPARLGRFTRPDGRPQRVMPLMRKVEVACLTPEGEVNDSARLVPAVPAFEDAFAAFTRANLVTTDRGLVAVGDLYPGDLVRTVDHGFQTLLWKGTTMLVPQAQGQDPAMGRLTRIAADALGIARPMGDLVLGPRARLIHRSPEIRRLTGQDIAAIPARDFIDGIGVVELTPATAVEVFHLGFSGHERIVANGVEVESYHPGPVHNLGLRPDMLGLFLSCFPHIAAAEDFGLPAIARLRLGDLDLTHVA
jgi:hypothetical protein